MGGGGVGGCGGDATQTDDVSQQSIAVMRGGTNRSLRRAADVHDILGTF